MDGIQTYYLFALVINFMCTFYLYLIDPDGCGNLTHRTRLLLYPTGVLIHIPIALRVFGVW